MILEGLKRHFALDAFRPGQAEVIASVMAGQNTVAVMPTGAGKSICYQLPATLLDGVALVVSPLIALMQDQVDQLKAKGIAAELLNSTLSESQRAERLMQVRAGKLKLLYCAPERLRSEPLLEALEGRLSLLAVDEAHCISQWGHDFRPDYALLGQIRKRLRPPRTLAVTATATPEVRTDIVRVLLMKDPKVLVAGFDRPNLFLEVVPVSGDADKRAVCLTLAAKGESGVIYCATRKQAETLHHALVQKNVDAVLYHAGLEDEARRQAQERFMSSERAVAVATNAFGMGIDKPSIRFVAHAGIPRTVEAYYQEIGRAGRDGQPAHAVLLFNHSDVYTQQRLIEGSHPPRTLVADVWNTLAHAQRYDRGLATLAASLGANELEVGAAIKILERAGHLSRAGRGEGRWQWTLHADATLPKSPDAHRVHDTLRSLGLTGEHSLSSLARATQLGESQVRHALHLLERAKALTVRKPFAGRTITAHQKTPFDALGLSLDHVRIQEKRAVLLLRRMTDYAYAKRCRRGFMLRYFGDTAPNGPCNACDVCAGHKLALAPKDPSEAANDNVEERYSVLAFEELRKWRSQLSRSLAMAPYLVFNDATLKNLAAALPTNRDEFLAVKGTGETRWERFGPKVTQVSIMARAAGDVPVTLNLRARRRR